MTFVDSDLMQGRRNGHIKLHGAEGFEGMRKAGQLTARGARPARSDGSARRHHRRARQVRLRVRPRPRRLSGAAAIIAATANRSAPRSTTSSATASPTTSRCATATSSTSTSPSSSTAGTATPAACMSRAKPSRRAQRLIDVTYESLMRGIAAVKPGGDDRRHRPRDPVLRRRRALLGGARLLRPRPRPAVPRRAQHPALRASAARACRCARACSSPSSR